MNKEHQAYQITIRKTMLRNSCESCWEKEGFMERTLTLLKIMSLISKTQWLDWGNKGN